MTHFDFILCFSKMKYRGGGGKQQRREGSFHSIKLLTRCVTVGSEGLGSSDLFTHQINKSTTQHFRVPAFVYFFAYFKASGAVTFSRRPMRADDLQFPLSTISSFSVCLPLRLAASLVAASRASLLYDRPMHSPSHLRAQLQHLPSIFISICMLHTKRVSIPI